MRFRTILPLAFIAACSDAPETPYSYDIPAVELNFFFTNDLLGPETVVLSVRPVSYRPDAGLLTFDDCTGPYSTLPEFYNDTRPIQVPSFSASPDGLESQMCGHRDPAALHFFKVWAQLVPQSGTPAGSWGPGPYDLVYAPASTDFRPFGPTGPVTSVPEGYSWLHRTCGAAGGTELGIVPTRSTVEMHRLEEGSDLSVKTTEENLAVECRFQLPPRDLGTRVAFDRAQQLIWSAEDTSLFYLSIPDEQHRTESVGIRQVRLADRAVSELAVVPGALALQTGAAGVLYVSTDEPRTYAVTTTAGISATLHALPILEFAHLSPDGLWFADNFYDQARISSVNDSNQDFWIPGSFVGWSPDSRLVYSPARPQVPPPKSPSAQEPLALFIVSPNTPDRPAQCGSSSADLVMGAGTLTWTSECPQVAYAPQSWSIESSIPSPDCEHCFGLAIQDPVTGAERSILDASAGLIHTVNTRPSPGVAFAWARTCLGLYNTVCSFSLLRVRLLDGSVETVAIADQEMPVALSWDNRRLAFAASDGIYIKDLPQ